MMLAKPAASATEIRDILYGTEGRFGYLFPNRKTVPTVKRHVFSDLHYGGARIDEVTIRVMTNLDYIGWTAKVVLGLDLFPSQIAQLQTIWRKPFPMLIASRGAGKSFLLAVYCVLRALLEPGTKIVIVGAGLRQAKLVFQYIEDIWHKAPVLKSIVGGGKKAGPKQTVDSCYFRIGDSIIYALPMGDGSKIRGFRANIVIADEFASIPEEIFDIVVRGFTATSKSPVEEARLIALERRLKELNCPEHISKQIFAQKGKGNQIVYSGTAYYAFNHFARRYEMWKAIIRSRGETAAVAEIFGGETNVPENFDWKDYAVIRLPYTHVQEGLLDRRQLAHAKAILPHNIFLMEYGACFVKDSDGFFPRSLIESCTTSPSKPILTPDGEIMFTPLMRGRPGRKYVIGIDPAAERDNLAVTVIEVWANHYRVVYCWTCNKSTFLKRKKRGLVTSDDYYAYCCWKIRDVVRLFSPVRVEMDSQGGGYAIAEMLRNRKLIDKAKGEFPLYEIIDYDEPKATDSETDGPHILHLIAQNTEFNSQSNLFMHKSFETKRLLFPGIDTVKMQAALAAEASLGVTVDTFEDVVNEIEELKNELCNIQMVQTSTGKERFETPNISETTQGGEGKKKSRRLRKDRYTSLLLAHRYCYDAEVTVETPIDYEDVAGNIHKTEIDPSEGMYRGPGVGQMRNADWARGFGVGAVKRGESVY